MIVCAASRSKSVSIHGPIGLKVSVFLARHNVRSPRLPGALAHVVADRPAEDAAERLGLGQVLGLAPDHRDELALVLHALGRVGRDDDRLAMRDQRVVGAIADIRRLRQSSAPGRACSPPR